MTAPTIRLMRPEDREAVIALLLASDPWVTLGYTRADWDRYFSPMPQDRETMVAERSGAIVGVAVLRQKFLRGDYLELLGVSIAARKAGIGRLLLTHIESKAFQRGPNLFACVSDFNQPARSFYRKQGYREVGEIPGLLKPGYSEILLHKTAPEIGTRK